jgi:hypothetical protein
MKKQISAILAAALVATPILSGQALALVPPPPPLVPPPGGGAGAGGAGGVIGVAGFLVIYDLIRRTTCSGDFLHLGGPGFTTKIKAGDTILTPPVCYVRKPRPLHAKG